MNEWELNETDLFDLYGCSSTLIARAADKKLVEWLLGSCGDKHKRGNLIRCECPDCWAELKKELGIEFEKTESPK